MTRRRTKPRPALPERTCANCGISFVPARRHQTYCKPAHRLEAKADRYHRRQRERLTELKARVTELEAKITEPESKQ
jgi:hypothetical protein